MHATERLKAEFGHLRSLCLACSGARNMYHMLMVKNLRNAVLQKVDISRVLRVLEYELCRLFPRHDNYIQPVSYR